MNYIKPRGTEDIYEDINLVKFIENTLTSNVKFFNFKEIRTPSFEEINLFSNSVGSDTDIISKEMFKLDTKGKKNYVLKPEGTASVTRFIIENKLYKKNPLPLKLFYLQNMYRYERPQKGRLREFSQFGVEIFGLNNNLIDIESIILADFLLKKLKINNYTVHINSLGTSMDREKYKKDLKKYFQNKEKCEDCQKRINTNPLRILDCKIEKINLNELPIIYDYLSKDEKNNLDFIIKSLKNNGINVVLDNNLVRGLDYYTNIVFEVVLNNDKYNNLTLLGGGRYDNLVKKLGGENLPAFGFGIGIQRLKIAIENQNNDLKLKEETVDYFVIILDKKYEIYVLNIINKIRNFNFSVEVNYNNNKNLKQQFKISEKFNPKNIMIIGESEFKSNTITLKNLDNKTNINVEVEKFLYSLKK